MPRLILLVLTVCLYAFPVLGEAGFYPLSPPAATATATCTTYGADGSCFSGTVNATPSGCCGLGLFQTPTSLFEGAFAFKCNDPRGVTLFGGYSNASTRATCNLCYQAGKLNSAGATVDSQGGATGIRASWSGWDPDNGVQQHQVSASFHYKTLYVDSIFSSGSAPIIHAVYNTDTHKFQCGYGGSSILASVEGLMTDVICEVPTNGNSITLKVGVTAPGAMANCKLSGGMANGHAAFDINISDPVFHDCRASLHYGTDQNNRDQIIGCGIELRY